MRIIFLLISQLFFCAQVRKKISLPCDKQLGRSEAGGSFENTAFGIRHVYTYVAEINVQEK